MDTTGARESIRCPRLDPGGNDRHPGISWAPDAYPPSNESRSWPPAAASRAMTGPQVSAPPLTWIIWPLMKAPPSEASSATAAATSSGVPSRPTGTFESMVEMCAA